MIGDTNCHCRGDLPPLFGRASTLGWYWRYDFFLETTVRPTEMIITKTQVKLTFHPILFLGEGYGLAGEPSILMTQRTILTFYESSIEVTAHF